MVTKMSRGKTTRPVGRPTAMTQEVRDYICVELASGRSLRSSCREEKMPAVSTGLLAVVQNRDGFSGQYGQAREAAGFAHADSIVEVVTQVIGGEIDDRTAHAAMDGLKWAAERMAPKYHSARQEIDHQSSDKSMSPKDTGAAVLAAIKSKHDTE